MMKLCFLSLLIEDVLAIGGQTGLAAAALAGKAAPTRAPKKEEPKTKAPAPKAPETKAPAPKEPKTTAPEPIAPKEPVAPTEETSEGISCGGHDADSCGACITAPGAPEGKEAASWCNGDCYVEFSDDVASCMPIESSFVDCGHHQAAECGTCTNKAVGGALFCNGVCAFNDKTNKCDEN